VADSIGIVLQEGIVLVADNVAIAFTEEAYEEVRSMFSEKAREDGQPQEAVSGAINRAHVDTLPLFFTELELPAAYIEHNGKKLFTISLALLEERQKKKEDGWDEDHSCNCPPRTLH
jgi:hypothetical protein